MTPERALFSESWHRVASQRLSLRPSVRIHRQSFRGEIWHIAEDSFTNQFFRFRPEAYAFVARLDGTRTVEQIWAICLDRDPERAPGQGEIVSMLSQLYQQNLIVSDVPPDTARLFERHQKRLRSEIKSQVFGIFYLRIPLFDPDTLLKRAWPVLRLLCTWGAGVAWLVMFALGLNAVITHWTDVHDKAQAVLEPGNLFLLYAGFALAKLIHEFGHATAVKKFGGEVHAMGVTFLVFIPIPYVDATAAWAFRERWKRVMVGFSGMIPEIFLASLAAVTWAYTGHGLLNSLAYNVMYAASITTVIFNINPLLRFDGYYILADLTDSPNLQPRAASEWLHLTEKHAFGIQDGASPARSDAEAFWLTVYGALSWAYRIFVTVSIILLVADLYLGIGLLAGVVTFIGSFVMPLVGAVVYLLRDPKIERQRKRAWAVSVAAAGLVFAALGVVPLPYHFLAPGIVRAAGSGDVRNAVDGWVRSVSARGAAPIGRGAEVVRLQNPALGLEIAAARADLEEAEARARRMLLELPAGIGPMGLRQEAAESKLRRLLDDRDALVVRSPESGTWNPPGEMDLQGAWMSRGSLLGEVVGKGPSWEFRAVVPQEYAGQLFGGGVGGAEIRFRGTSGTVFRVPKGAWRVVPGRQDTLPSPALGWMAGGPVAVQLDGSHDNRRDASPSSEQAADSNGTRTVEPFFLVVAQVEPVAQPAGHPADRVLWQGRVGEIRFDLPPAPLLVRWTREFRQLLQRRYQI